MFLENFQKAYNLNVNITLLSFSARCKFIQYMPNKPNKFDIKFWMAIDVKSKYLYNEFLYLWEGLDEKWRCQLADGCGDEANDSFIQTRFQCHV